MIRCCPVCSASTTFLFTKDFDGDCGLRSVVYHRCTDCGFVFSPTIYGLTDAEWESANAAFHFYQHATANPTYDKGWSVRLERQTATLSHLARSGVIPTIKPWLDFACGGGHLVKLLGYERVRVLGYDPYMVPDNGIRVVTADALTHGAFDCVIATSVVEHFRGMEAFERLASLVSDTGVLVLHTSVCNRYPANPSWFYYLPVHCSFFTEDALGILANRYGFHSRTYAIGGDLHLWARSPRYFDTK